MRYRMSGTEKFAEVGDHDLADLAGAGRAVVDEELHDVGLVDHVVVGRAPALVRDARELPRAVLVEDLGVEAALRSASRTLSGRPCAEEMIAFGENPGLPPSRT